MDKREHPVRKGHFATEDGIILGPLGQILTGQKQNGSFLLDVGRTRAGSSQRWSIGVHIFVYECFHGVIDTNAYVVIHRDGDRANNRLANLTRLLKADYYTQMRSRKARKHAPASTPTENHDKEHPIHKGYYASADGTVLGKSNKILTGSWHMGYKRIDMQTEGKSIARFVHVIVYECFHGVIDSSLYDIDHIDGNKTNNALINLQALTRAEHIAKTRATVSFSKPKDETLQTDLVGEIWATPVRPAWRSTQVSNFGRFKNGSGKISTGVLRGPYKSKCIKGKNYRTHRIIAEVWHGLQPSDLHTVDHIDRIAINNTASNLRWATPHQQAENQSQAISVSAYALTGEWLGTWPTMSLAASATKTHSGNIGRVLQGQLKQTGGLMWRRALACP